MNRVLSGGDTREKYLEFCFSNVVTCRKIYIYMGLFFKGFTVLEFKILGPKF